MHHIWLLIVFLNIRTDALVVPSFQLIDNIMPELSSNSRYEYLHISTCPTTASDGLISSLDQLKHNIMPKLTGYTSYKNSQLQSDLGSAPYILLSTPLFLFLRWYGYL